jgi:hypothetical protein
MVELLYQVHDDRAFLGGIQSHTDEKNKTTVSMPAMHTTSLHSKVSQLCTLQATMHTDKHFIQPICQMMYNQTTHRFANQTSVRSFMPSDLLLGSSQVCQLHSTHAQQHEGQDGREVQCASQRGDDAAEQVQVRITQRAAQQKNIRSSARRIKDNQEGL